ncbi:uncharacterized protein RAG0_06665 [Rhynchosporium agropyri]|uniref:Sm domain-containing protein n=1 Tax=Rhynchosporium agropyri TaxID=914238 RepID=A0A1E1KI52_9HELO|nr:uncharacterized protein RAG0_06665 [Rhynchosporium agropyri]
MDKPSSENYLTSLLNKTLRVTTTDTRMFLGQFKCTDSDLNIILSQTYEYRLPPPPKPLFRPPTTPTTTSQPTPSQTTITPTPKPPIVQDLTSRYLGLVVVPGEYITRIEVEEFESQVKGRGQNRLGSVVEEKVESASGSGSGDEGVDMQRGG